MKIFREFRTKLRVERNNLDCTVHRLQIHKQYIVCFKITILNIKQQEINLQQFPQIVTQILETFCAAL